MGKTFGLALDAKDKVRSLIQPWKTTQYVLGFLDLNSLVKLLNGICKALLIEQELST